MRLAAKAAALLTVSLSACATAPPPPSGSASYADYLIGRVANARQDHDIAADRYFSALRRAPEDEALLNGAMLAALASGDVERAREAAHMAARSPAVGYAQLVLAAEALAAGRMHQADIALQRVEGPAAEELIARMLGVWSRTAGGEVDDVILDLGPLAAIRPYGGLFAYQQAMALEYAGREDAALATYQAAAQGGLWLPAGIERHADLLARRGAREQALALLDTEQNLQSPVLVAALARLRDGAGAASTPITPALGASAGLQGLSAIFLQEADQTNAMAALSLSLILDPNADGARLAFAQAQADAGRVESAQAMLRRISPDSPFSESARRLQAWMLLDAGREDEAFALARATAEAGGARARRALADMYRSKGRYADAEPLYSSLVEQSPRDWRLYFARGAARERLGRWSEAEADLQHALELSPEQADVMNYLGYAWIERGEHTAEALGMIERAVALKPTSGAIIDSLGWAHYRMGAYDLALTYLERAVELEPGDATLNDHLGDVYWRLGRRIEARFQWQRALTQEPDDAAAIEAKLANGMPPASPRQSATR